jgi:hypothetical protein
VRPWLAVIGVIFLTLAGGILAALFLSGGGNLTVVTTPSPYRLFLSGPNGTEELPFNGSLGTSEQFSLVWRSSSPVQVILEQTSPCYSPCPTGPVLIDWPSNVSGSWSGTGPFHFPLQCLVENMRSQPANVTLTGRAVSSTPIPLSLAVELLLGAGAGGLFIVGGLAVFLGLFLKADPYGSPTVLVHRSPDEPDELGLGHPPIH